MVGEHGALGGAAGVASEGPLAEVSADLLQEAITNPESTNNKTKLFCLSK